MKQYEAPITLIEVIEVKHFLVGVSNVPVINTPTDDTEAEESKPFNFTPHFEDY